MLGHHRHFSETPFKWLFAGRPMMGYLYWYLEPSYPHELKTRFQRWAPLTKFSGSASSMGSSLASSLKKRSLMTIQNRVKRSLFTTQINAVEL